MNFVYILLHNGGHLNSPNVVITMSRDTSTPLIGLLWGWLEKKQNDIRTISKVELLEKYNDMIRAGATNTYAKANDESGVDIKNRIDDYYI